MRMIITNKLAKVSYGLFLKKPKTTFQFGGSYLLRRIPLFAIVLAISLTTPLQAQEKTACKVDCGELVGGNKYNLWGSWSDVKFYTKNIFLSNTQYNSDQLSSYILGSNNITFNNETANGRGDYGIGVVGPSNVPGSIAAQINYIAEKNRSEKLLVDFGCTFTGADVKLARFFSDENGGKGETGGWRAFDENFNLVGIGAFAANVPFTPNSPGLFDLRIRVGAPFRYIEFTARAYAENSQKTAFDDNSDYYLQSIIPTCQPITEAETALGDGTSFNSWDQASITYKPLNSNLFFAANANNFTPDGESVNGGLGVPNDEDTRLNYCTDDNTSEFIQIDLGGSFTALQLIINDLFEGEEGYWIAYNYDANFQLVEVGSGTFVGSDSKSAQKVDISGQSTTSGVTSSTGGFRVINVGGGPLGGGKNAKSGKTSCSSTGFYIRQFVPDPSCLGASEVVSYIPGKNKLGTPVISDRQVLSNALFAPQFDDTPGDINFVALGFGGQITVKFLQPFANGPGADVQIVETSYEEDGKCASHPEKAEVFASQNGIDFVYLGQACRDEATFDLGPLSWAQYIRIIDISEPGKFSQTNAAVDGYDVDGVICLNGKAESTPNDGLIACTAQDVIQYKAGTRKDGNQINNSRTNPNKALYDPDSQDSENGLVALGFGDGIQKGENATSGFITLRFDYVIFDKPGKDIKIFESSPGDPRIGQFPETVKVYASKDGKKWVFLEKSNTNCYSKIDSEFEFGGKITWAQYIKIVDITDKHAKKKTSDCKPTNQNAFNNASDGFDVDAVVCTGYTPKNSKSLEEEATLSQSEQSLSGYPNPVVDKISVDLSQEEFVAPDINIIEVKVYNFMGHEVGTMNAELDNEFHLDLDMSGFEPGVYILKVQNENVVRTLRVMKK